MAENNDAYDMAAIREILYVDRVLRTETFMEDGLFNVAAAAQVQIELRLRNEQHWRYVGGADNYYITKITGLGHFPRWGNRPNRIIDDWIIFPIACNAHTTNGALRYVKSIWHIHRKSKLVCCTYRTAKYEWWCDTCDEPVPPGIIFAARTEGLRQAM